MNTQPALVEVIVNGESKSVPPKQTVLEVLKWLEIPSDRVAVELNKRLVRKRDWEGTIVPDAAQIEVVEFVGGG